MAGTQVQQNLVNHIALVLDASSSMKGHATALIKVADEQIKYLAQRSQELKQETRVSVYAFADTVQPLIWDMDVLRVPSIAQLYTANGMTALIDATMVSVNDLAEIPTKYGDHSFLIFVLTDGEENQSRMFNQTTLGHRIGRLADNWTLAFLVPNQRSRHATQQLGVPGQNIEVWDATTQQGLERAVERIQQSTDAYMVLRSSGVRGSKALFSTGRDAVNAATVAASGLVPLPMSAYHLVPVPQDSVIKEFVEGCGFKYVLGRNYYQLVKPEKIQAQKLLAVVEKKTSKVYLGREARDLVGLPLTEVRVKPDFNPDYDIFVQSTSVNRKLPVGSKLLILT